MTTYDWFVGSASKRLGQQGWVHAIGFRSEQGLLALVSCDLPDIAGIDATAITAHITLHPIEPVEVILVANSSQSAVDYATLNPATKHHAIHAIVDAIIDTLTFGCPATLRVTPHVLQWRKFDEQPIATLTLHPRQQPIDTALHQQLTHDCGDPVLMVYHAWDNDAWDNTTIAAQLATCSATPVTSVDWHHHDDCWLLHINHTTLGVIPGTVAINPLWPHHLIAARPHVTLTAAQTETVRFFLHEANHDVNHD
jgi:hypothetical protein